MQLIHGLVAFMLGFGPLYATQEVFTTIYDKKIWGKNAEGLGTSGFGSTEENTREYRRFLQDFLKAHAIRSVVDVGCGDWEFSRLIDWTGIDYLGYDVVDSVIKRNIEHYQNSHIRFLHGDGIQSNLPRADLLICKDVLQHISNKQIKRLIAQFPKFKYCLITNVIDPKTRKMVNQDTRAKATARTVDLRKPPFNVKGKKVLTYNAIFWERVLLIERE